MEVFGIRVLVVGLVGDFIYLIVKEDGSFDSIGIVDSCIYLGCIFFWNGND